MVVLIVLVHVEKGVEKKNGVALLPQSFLHTPQVLAGLAANAITFFFMGVQSILMAPYLQLVAGWSPIDVGVISIVTASPPSRWRSASPSSHRTPTRARHPGGATSSWRPPWRSWPSP